MALRHDERSPAPAREEARLSRVVALLDARDPLMNRSPRPRDHLHDLLLRSLFKSVGHDGTYQSTVEKPQNPRPLDWATRNEPASKLATVSSRMGARG